MLGGDSMTPRDKLGGSWKGERGTLPTIMDPDDVVNALLRSEAGPARLLFEL